MLLQFALLAAGWLQTGTVQDGSDAEVVQGTPARADAFRATSVTVAQLKRFEVTAMHPNASKPIAKMPLLSLKMHSAHAAAPGGMVASARGPIDATLTSCQSFGACLT